MPAIPMPEPFQRLFIDPLFFGGAWDPIGGANLYCQPSADPHWNLLWLLPGLPFLGAFVLGLMHLRDARRRAAHAGHGHGHDDQHGHGAQAPWSPLVLLLAIGPIAAAFAIAAIGFSKLLALPEGARTIASGSWRWIDAGALDIDLSLALDPLSSVMTLVVTGVGALIFVYALGYMAGDAGRTKFFAYLNLFAAAMLLLVLSSNLIGLFVGWEGVGLCSYLLIGFWYAHGPNAEAGQKAFVVNRIGDACFLLGSFLLATALGSLELADLSRGATALAAARPELLAAACLLLFGGCCGKSAQFPLFTWLPDAMAGPTPVSALIHAATMVTAGIYLIARLFPLFAASELALTVVAVAGALTALIGASTALVQRDIKRVLAYSTVSQLGYMFLGLGAGAPVAAVFHLVTHAFFKALLFLGAGSVIHGLSGEQDMRKMGGLRAHMPRTYATFLAGAAALSGLPLFSGYFSKDEILAHAFARGGVIAFCWLVGIVAACLTAFYTWRMVALTFHGEPRYDRASVHPHESPAVMTVPLAILAVLAVVGGLLGLPPVLPVAHALEHWLAPVLGPAAPGMHGAEPAHLSHGTEWALLILGAGLAAYFAHRGFHAYRAGVSADERFDARRPALSSFLSEAWKIDAGYAARVVRPLLRVADWIADAVDTRVVDGAVNGAATLARGSATALRALADGSSRTYALWMGAGAAALALWWVVA